MARRQFLTQLLGLPFLSVGAKAEEPKKKTLKIMMKSAWGSDDPTKAAFPFHHGLALAEAGHEVQIFLFGESHLVDAQSDRQRCRAGGLAAAQRGA
jgi:hypothetical protein